MAVPTRSLLFVLVIAIILFASNAHAFGAGNIASISAIEGKNWRHGDLEDLLKQVTCIRHHKWNTMMIKRVYFGNWLRDYSQAMDTGTLKKANAETIRILVWLLSFLGFGYATAEFEVTSERLGVYRPEEHIDNPKDYNENQDARPFDPRLRGPIRPVELEIDPDTGMKNYIANKRGDWATSAAFVRYSFERSIHHGRAYIGGSGMLSKGDEEDLAEALRCLGQGLHTLEDFGAHTNYVELALVELGHRNVFAHVGTQTGITLRGKHVSPLVTGTFGTVDFYHSVLGEATDHFTQSEVNEMDNALGIAQQSASSSNPLTTLIKLLSKVPGTRDLCSEAEKLQQMSADQARYNSSRGMDQSSSRSIGDDQYSASRAGPDSWNAPRDNYPNNQYGQSDYSHQQSYGQPPASQYHDPNPPSWQQHGQQQYHELPAGGYGQQQQQQYNQPPPSQYQTQSQHPQQQPQDQSGQAQWSQQQTQSNLSNVQDSNARPAQTGQQAPPQGLPGLPDFDPAKTIKQIYPILAFRDKVVRTISGIIEKIPGLEALVDRIVETLTVFILSLLAPFVRPILTGLTTALKTGSAGVIDSSGKHQYEVWTDPRCSDPTHSMLSKDHFSNMLNPPAGAVAGEILKYIAPRVLYAWENPNVPVDRVLADVEGIFHHPAIRDERNECHRNMFSAVKRWRDSLDDRGRSLDDVLSMQGVKEGKNHKGGVNEHLGHGGSMQQGGHGGSSSGYGGSQNQQQGGIGGYVNSAQSLYGAVTGHSGSSQQHQNSQQGGFGSFLNQAENLVGSFTGQGQHHGGSSQQHYGGNSGGSGGGLGDMLSMASHLPIPGVQNLSSTFNKYSSFIPGGRTRGIDEGGDEGESRGREISRDIPTTGYESLNVPHAAQIGGAQELREALASQGDRSPSPMPLGPPSGYENYSSRGQSYDGSGYRSEQPRYGSQYGSQDQYDGGRSHGGHSQGYEARDEYNDGRGDRDQGYEQQDRHDDGRNRGGRGHGGSDNYYGGGGGEGGGYYRG